MTVNQTLFATQMTAAISAVNAVISTIGSLEDDSPIVVQTVYSAVQSNRVPFDNAITAFDADIDITSVGSVVVGIPAPMMATALLNQAKDVRQEWQVIVAEAYLIRVGQNCLNAHG